MNTASKKLCLILASAAFVVAGCSKKPKRPDPSSTVLGPTTGGTITPEAVPVTADTSSQLAARDPNIIETDDMIKGLLGAVYFDFDKSNIKEGERAKIQAAKDYLAKNPTHRILFEGHCDWRGTDEYNLSLGDRRSTAAKKYLASLGIPENKIEANSKGSLEAAKNADDATMAKDRRAEIIVLKK
jgi:peptidoglycan-associated lipoprotein